MGSYDVEMLFLTDKIKSTRKSLSSLVIYGHYKLPKTQLFEGATFDLIIVIITILLIDKQTTEF